MERVSSAANPGPILRLKVRLLGISPMVWRRKPHDQLEQVGLSLAEAKELLGRVQERVVGAQASAFVADNRRCGACANVSGARAECLSNFVRRSVTCR